MADERLDSVPLRMEHPERVPAARYYDEAFFALERERFWPRVWQMACRLEEIPKVGDWIEYRILDRSVIVVRTKGGVKAFENACRHRGVQLASGHGNCADRGFNCPFHGWRWDMDGKSIFVYGKELFSDENLDPDELDLVSCRVELWGGCAFINFDKEARPLLDCIQPVVDSLGARNVEHLKVEWWHSAVVPTNWKLAMEAFMEGFHTMRTHPQLHRVLPTGRDRYSPSAKATAVDAMQARQRIDHMIGYMKVLSEGMAGMIHANDIAVAEDLRSRIELPEDPQQAMAHWNRALNDAITADGRARGVPMPDLNKAAAEHPVAPVQYVFPHFFMLPMFGNMTSYRVRPLTPETCLFEIWSLVFYPEDEARERPVAPEPMAHDDPRFPPIPQQDYANLPLQQLGLHAAGFEYMRLSRDVEGMISNYQRLIDGFLAGLDQQALLEGQRICTGDYETPIADLGF